jgi:predicted MFS family arabinose efflux permease
MERRERAGRLRSLVIDPAPLQRDVQFRRLWIGQVGSGFARETARITIPLHVYALTESPALVGLVALVQLLPALLFSLVGGALADAVDRRRLMIIAQIAMGLATLGLLGLSFLPDPPIPLILLCAALLTTFFAVEHPARTSAAPRLVPPERLSSAIALTSLNFQVSGLVAPAVAGVVIALSDVSVAYAIQGLAYSWAIVMTLRVMPIPPLGKASRPSLRGIAEGLGFIGRRRVILGAVVIDLNAMIFGLPIAIFPVLAIEMFGVGVAGVGFLAGARGGGALVAALLSGWVRTMDRTGRAVLTSVAVYAAVTVAVGIPGLPFLLAIPLVAVAGAADLLSAVLRNVIIQSVTDDEFRGRVSAAHGLATQSGPRLGDIRAALMTEAYGAHAAVLVGGMLAAAGTGLVAWLFPDLRAYSHHEVVRRAAAQATAAPDPATARVVTPGRGT